MPLYYLNLGQPCDLSLDRNGETIVLSASNELLRLTIGIKNTHIGMCKKSITSAHHADRKVRTSRTTAPPTWVSVMSLLTFEWNSLSLLWLCSRVVDQRWACILSGGGGHRTHWLSPRLKSSGVLIFILFLGIWHCWVLFITLAVVFYLHYILYVIVLYLYFALLVYEESLVDTL